MKKILIIALVGAIGLSLAACGSGNPETSTTTTTTEAESQTDEVETESQTDEVETDSDTDEDETPEISLDEAMYNFTEVEAQEYFVKHKDEYIKIDSSVIDGQTFDATVIVISSDYSSYGHYTYVFESGGKIYETALSLSDQPSGYLNGLSWDMDGSTLIISSGDSDESYHMFEVEEGVYVGYQSGEATMLLIAE